MECRRAEPQQSEAITSTALAEAEARASRAVQHGFAGIINGETQSSVLWPW
jgi:hypothetical protein